MYQINVVRNNDVIADYIECNTIHQYRPVNIQNKENRYIYWFMFVSISNGLDMDINYEISYILNKISSLLNFVSYKVSEISKFKSRVSK